MSGPLSKKHVRISGRSTDIDFWRRRTSVPPIIFLDGQRVDGFVLEARDGECGYVRIEVVDEDGKPILANVVLPSGEIIEQIIATRMVRGRVTIVLPEAVP
jgi:hypothetical protein